MLVSECTGQGGKLGQKTSQRHFTARKERKQKIKRMDMKVSSKFFSQTPECLKTKEFYDKGEEVGYCERKSKRGKGWALSPGKHGMLLCMYIKRKTQRGAGIYVLKGERCLGPEV